MDEVKHYTSNYLESQVLLQDQSPWEVQIVSIATVMPLLSLVIVDLRTRLSS